MICTLDANALILWVDKKTDDITVARLELLFEKIAKARGKLIVPTPSLAEALVHTQEATSAWVDAMSRKSAFLVAPFDFKAAMECAFIDRLARVQGHKKAGAVKTEPWQKIKVDRQIAAIAKVHQTDLLITGDVNLQTVCRTIGIGTSDVSDLEAPQSALQRRLELTPPKN